MTHKIRVQGGTILYQAVDENTDLEEFSNMVVEVNETQVEEEEVLSNRVYFFSRQSGKIKFQ